MKINKIRLKKILKVKEAINPKKDYYYRNNEIRKIVEFEHKYFGNGDSQFLKQI